MKKIIIVVFLIMASVQTGRGEPTPTIRYLMNEPVSMLDYGIKWLEDSLIEEWNFDVLEVDPGISVKYDWDTNRIRIKYIYLSPSPNYQYPEKLIKEKMEKVVHLIKSVVFGIDPSTGKPMSF